MRTVPTSISAKLTTGSATMCYCWKVTRRDNTILGFTDHDKDLIIDGITYTATSGFEATVLDTDLGYNSSDIAATGIINSTDITEEDILIGLYDDAQVQLLWVDWSEYSNGDIPTYAAYVILLTGYVGEIKINGAQIEVEVKSLMDRLNRNIGRIYRRTCDAIFCDDRCGLNAYDYTSLGTITDVLASDTFVVSGLSSASGLYTYGNIIFTSGTLQNSSFDVKMSTLVGTLTYVELWAPVPMVPLIGDTFSIIQGCGKTLKYCKSFDNIVNFRGFPQIPGNSVLTQVPTPGDIDNTGGSLITYD